MSTYLGSVMAMTKRHRIIGTLLCIVLVGAVAANLDVTLSSPPEWLVNWTVWVATAAAILLVPGLIADATTSLRLLAKREQARDSRSSSEER